MIEESTTKSYKKKIIRPEDSDNRKKKSRESLVSSLAIMLGGEMGVVPSSKIGIVDIVTDELIIEVEDSTFWKEAIGRVLVYGQEFDSLSPVIYLFGNCSDNKKKMINSFASRFDVKVIFHEEE